MYLSSSGLAFAATPDVMPLVEAEVLARAVAAWEPQDAATRFVAERAADARAGQDFLDLFQIEDALQKAGYYADWQKKYGPEGWAVLEKYTGKLS